jgi:hypothetical protein
MPAKKVFHDAASVAIRNALRSEFAGAPPDSLFDVYVVAAVLDTPPRTLETWRKKGRGPACVRLGRAVRYRRRDVESWVAAGGRLEPSERAKPAPYVAPTTRKGAR